MGASPRAYARVIALFFGVRPGDALRFLEPAEVRALVSEALQCP